MTTTAGQSLANAVANNPYDWEGMDKTEQHLRENEWTGVGWYWTRGGRRIAGTFGSGSKPKVKTKPKLPPFDWRKSRPLSNPRL